LFKVNTGPLAFSPEVVEAGVEVSTDVVGGYLHMLGMNALGQINTQDCIWR
jgi:hypothetical protein